MNAAENYTLVNPQGKPILMDLRRAEVSQGDLLVFCHGFKGFKDWGAFDLVSQRFAETGIDFLKFNFSHNGTTPEHPQEFVDLEAFAKNTFSQEMEDLDTVIQWVKSANSPLKPERIHLMGHSRGGGLAVLCASEKNMASLTTWAAVSDFGKKWSEDFLARAREKNGVVVKNGRTGQDMPIYYSFYQDYLDHFQRLSIPLRALEVRCPSLIVHGRNDQAVHFDAALDLNKWITGSELLLLNAADHTFGARHPWTDSELPEDLEKVVRASIEFISASSSS